jgi:hypothetical protein
MPDRRETDDARLQRLADLTIEIRMLKARVQAEMEEHRRGESKGRVSDASVLSFRNPLNGASCPHCGHTAGLALLPREYRRTTTPVRCFECGREAAAGEWAIAIPQVTPPRTAADAFSSRRRQ